MVAVPQDLRYGHAAKDGRLGVLRIFQERRIERIVSGPGSCAEDSGNHAGYGIGNGHSRQFTASEDVVADGNGLIGQILFDAVIDAFVMAA